MALEVTFLKEKIESLLKEPGDQLKISIGYDEKGRPLITAESFGSVENSDSGGKKVNGCPYPPGC